MLSSMGDYPPIGRALMEEENVPGEGITSQCQELALAPGTATISIDWTPFLGFWPIAATHSRTKKSK